MFDYTLRILKKKKKKKYLKKKEKLTKQVYKPKYQTRASLCHVIKREHTDIKHLTVRS